MKQKLLLSSLFFIVLGGSYFAYFLDSFTEPIDSKLEHKYAPSDQFFFQRAYPESSFDIVTYQKALESAKAAALTKNLDLAIFNENWQTEGPGNLGARVNTVAVHPTNDNIIFAGYSGGGIFKTTNGGVTWKPVFDDQIFLAIGDIVFDPNNPNTLYVGTGDPNISGFPFLGDGVYKSTDLGETWTYLGLEEVRIISKIIVHPTNDQVLYVAAMGLPFKPNTDKGLYKSEDGGQTWDQVLFLGGITGVIDVVLDRNNPEIIYAAGWDRLRNNIVSETSGQGAKIHKSIDGGNSWQQLSGGLPMDDQSRIGLATTSDGLIAVYVNPLHNFQGLYKTIDQGLSWTPIIDIQDPKGFNDGVFAGFGWYFAKVRVNPFDDNDISVLGVRLNRTQNGGDLWGETFNIHADVHDLVFSSAGKEIIATDGGLYAKQSTETTWQDIENIPTTQIYRVAYNPHNPEKYYAGAQDNGTSEGNQDGINEWQPITGGDGFKMLFHPTDPNIFYTKTQRGAFSATFDGGVTMTSATFGIAQNDKKNWDMPYIMSSHNPSTLFAGTQLIYRSDAEGLPDWKPISPDLTDGETEFRSQSMSTIHQSPINESLLYAGTSDGNIWRADLGGETWDQLNGLPKRYISEIEASPTFEQTVYVALSGYKDNDNTPLLYKSEDLGETWTSISGNLPPLAINCFLVVPGYQDKILFVGTDGGVYGSIDGGEIWERVGDNMPIIAVFDLEWNSGENTLVAATFARSVMSYSLEGIVEGDNLSSVDNRGIERKAFNLYPNPVIEELTLEFINEKPNSELSIGIYTINGRLIKQTSRRTGREVNWKINVSDLSSGVYIVKLEGALFNYVHQFVKS